MIIYMKSLKICVSSYKVVMPQSKGETTYDHKYKHLNNKKICLFRNIRTHPGVSSLILSEANLINLRR